MFSIFTSIFSNQILKQTAATRLSGEVLAAHAAALRAAADEAEWPALRAALREALGRKVFLDCSSNTLAHCRKS